MQKSLPLLASLIFLCAGLAFVHHVVYFDWIKFYACVNKPISMRRANPQKSGGDSRPDSLKLAERFKVAELQGSGTNYTLVVRDALTSEQYIISERRWNQMSSSLQKTVTEKWIQFTKGATASQMDMAHTFYEMYLNSILADIDAQAAQLSSVIDTEADAEDYCGRIFTVANADFFHTEGCLCKRGEIKTAIGSDAFLCTQINKPTSFVETSLSKNVPLPVPTADHYAAPYPRSITIVRYNQTQQFALTPDLDALVPIN